jgi:hypothetical protein
MQSKMMSEKLKIELPFAKCYTDKGFRLAPNDNTLLGSLHTSIEKAAERSASHTYLIDPILIV